MTKREIEKQLSSPDVRIGFEVEVIIPQYTKEKGKAINQLYQYQDMVWEYDIYVHEMEDWKKEGGRAPSVPSWARKMGYKGGDIIPNPSDLFAENTLAEMKSMATYFRLEQLPIEYKVSSYRTSDKNNWLVKPDGTIGYDGFEISSPILSTWEFLYIVPKLFRHIDKYGRTDESCGFHVSISFTDDEWYKELDAVKMGLFVDEKFIYKHFPSRKDNEYAESVHEDIRNIINNDTWEAYKIFNALEKKRKRKPKFTEDHHKAINIEHLRMKNKYVEFRYIGGKNYHQKWDATKEIVAMWIKAMRVARTEYKQGEYLQMLENIRNGKRVKYATM